MLKYQGMLCAKIGDEWVSVCPARIDEQDGGVFAATETDRKSSKKTISFHRLGTIDPARLEAIDG
jgi:hypothetical protein